MKLQLNNFRCYEDKTFEFGDDGLVLISAYSGAGKSTILMAIHFVLFGTGTKISSYGKTSCKVELEFESLKIIRTKRPNRLVLYDENGEYDDAVAQEIINRKFGDTFDVTGYISQNALNSFIIMSPSDKLEFLEKFAFKDIKLTEIKVRCASLIKQRNDTLNKTMTRLEMTMNTFNSLEKPEEVAFPIKCSKANYEKASKNEEIRKKNCDTLIKRSRIAIDKAQNELTDVKVLISSLQDKKDNIDSLTKQIDNISNEEKEYYYEGDDKLDMYKNKLAQILNQRELIILEERYKIDKEKLEKMCDAELEKLNTELEHIKDSLWKEYTKDEVMSLIKETKDSLKDAKKVSFLKSELKDCEVDETSLNDNKSALDQHRSLLDDKRQLLDKIKKQKLMYTCPSCNNKLHLLENKLILSDDTRDDIKYDMDDIEDDIHELRDKIKKLEMVIPKMETKLNRKQKLEKDIENIITQYEELNEDSLQDDIEYLENYHKAELVKEKKISVIEDTITQKVFPSFGTFEKELIKLEKQIKNIKIVDESVDDTDEEELRKIIIREENNKLRLDKITITKRKLEADRTKYEKLVSSSKNSHIEQYGSIRDINELENTITDEKTNINKKETEKEEHINNLENIKKFNDYQKEKTNYEIWEKKFRELQGLEKEDRNKYTAALLLKEKILEAESISVANIVESINSHAQIYLDAFFVENPIIVRLLPFKETKKATKPQINIDIQYKEMECDLNMLSGGELSRVVLAFTLALAEMFNTPMLMLDESTASLDQEATTVVFDAIKENFKGKIVLIIAHQTVNGIFDKIIKL